MKKIIFKAVGTTVHGPAWPGLPPYIALCAANEASIKNFVEKNEIPPAKVELQKEGGSSEALSNWWRYGGYPTAHLHLGDQIYPLTNTQWVSAAELLKVSIKAELGTAGTIGFEEFSEKLVEADLRKRTGM
jgi:hypothetical protein